MNPRLKRLKKVLDPSRALTSGLVVPCPPCLQYLPYQLAAVEYASQRQHTLIGDDPGSGKTIMAVAVSNYLPGIRKVLIICPAFLKPHWRREWLRWDTKGLSVGIVEGTKETLLPDTDVVVVNYDILKYYRHKLRERIWDLMIADEVHKLKSKKADRTREVFGGIKRNSHKQIVDKVKAIKCRMSLHLTGTPTLNGKPKEMWNLIQYVDPQGLGSNWYSFAKRYCKLVEFQGPNGKIVMWDGEDNIEELQERMRQTFMIRRIKADILPQLPPKRRMIIPVAFDKNMKKLLGKEAVEFEMTKDIGDFETTNFEGFSRIMKQIGLALVEPTIEIIESDLEEYDKIVVTAYHKEVVEKIAFHFDAMFIHGEVAPGLRQELVDAFQDNPKHKLIVGTIGAMGIGFNLTKSHLMILPERSWVPGDVTQAEDRIHRIGQTEQALYKHVVLEGGQSERQVAVLIAKQERIEKMLDSKSKP